MERITFEETFKDNSNDWWIGNDEIVKCEIIDGHYFMEHKRDIDDYSCWKNIPLLESKAYSLEAAFTFLSGCTKNGFGFLLGQKSNSGTKDSYSGLRHLSMY
jgi:hypothetical protein